MSNTGINLYVRVFVRTYVFISLESIPQRGIAGSKDNSISLFGEQPNYFKVSAPFYCCRIIQYVSSCDRLISYIIMSSSFIHVVAHFQFPSFLKLNNIPLHGYIIFWLFVHLLMDTWVDSNFWLCE